MDKNEKWETAESMNFTLSTVLMSWILGIWTVLKVTHSTLRHANTHKLQTWKGYRKEPYNDLMGWKKYLTAGI